MSTRLASQSCSFWELGAIGAALAPWALSNAALLTEFSAQLHASAGLNIKAHGRSTFSLLPRPHVSIDGIALEDAGGAVSLEADRLEGNVDILPLFAGRLEVAEVTLAHPRITVDLDRKPMSSAGAANRAAAAQPASAEARRADKARLGVVSIANGSARITYEGVATAIDDIDARLDWRQIGAAATFTATFDWRGERVQALLWVARPGSVLRGEQSPTTARLDCDSIHIEAEGFGQVGAKPRFTGRLAVASPSLRQALGLLDIKTPLPGPFEHVQLSAQASLAARDIQLSAVRLFADDNEFEGAFALRHEGDRPIVQATLASNFVSLKPMLSDVPPLLGADGQWNREAFELPDLTGADVDVRLSAAHARLARLSINDAALSVILRGGRLEIALAEAKAYKGVVKAHATFSAATNSTLDVHATAQTTGIDAGALLWDVAERQNFSGALNSQISLDASGDSVSDLMHDLDGRASLSVTEGEIGGVDLERALHRLDKRPLSSALQFRSGRSSVDKASATLQIVKGTASIGDASAQGPGFALVMSGVTRIADRNLALSVKAVEADGAGKPLKNGQQIDFELTGQWDEPDFTPDTQALIKRSGAAAPLLPRLPATPPAPEATLP